MASNTQYGQTLYLQRFESTAPAVPLRRVHFVKGASNSEAYDERWLQLLLMKDPSVLPVDQIEPAFAGLVPVCTELPVRNAGYLDNLFVTSDGNIVLVECKLWRNPEARREVVAQILDYAKEMASWNYSDLQDAIRLSNPQHKPKTLFDFVRNDCVDEVAFHDAISRNLRRGRFLLLIVGDGIREGVETMADFLQQYAGFHFTLGLVEIAVFELPSSAGYVAQPRVLAKTVNIERAIVTVDESSRIALTPPVTSGLGGASAPKPTTITEEQFYERLDSQLPGASKDLKSLVGEFEAQNITPEFGKDCMILRWRPDTTKSWNLATIYSSGIVSTDFLGQQLGGIGLLELHTRYLHRLSEIVPGATVKKTPKQAGWYVALEDKPIHINCLLANGQTRRGWIQAINDLEDSVLTALHDDH